MINNYKIKLHITKRLIKTEFGGSILPKRFVVTATHCIPRDLKLVVVVRAHKFQIKNANLYRVKRAIIHEKCMIVTEADND